MLELTLLWCVLPSCVVFLLLNASYKINISRNDGLITLFIIVVIWPLGLMVALAKLRPLIVDFLFKERSFRRDKGEE